MVGVGQPVEKKIPPGGISQPMLRMSREERPNIPPERMVGLMVMTMGPQIKMGTPMTMAIAQMKIEDLVGIETLQIEEEEDLLERMEIQMEEMEVLTLMTVEMEMILHPQQILLLLEGEGIENLNMFMYYKGLQDHQARKGNLDNLDKHEGMAEMDKQCH